MYQLNDGLLQQLPKQHFELMVTTKNTSCNQRYISDKSLTLKLKLHVILGSSLA